MRDGIASVRCWFDWVTLTGGRFVRSSLLEGEVELFGLPVVGCGLIVGCGTVIASVRCWFDWVTLTGGRFVRSSLLEGEVELLGLLRVSLA